MFGAATTWGPPLVLLTAMRGPWHTHMPCTHVHVGAPRGALCGTYWLAGTLLMLLELSPAVGCGANHGPQPLCWRNSVAAACHVYA
jgi:hypothetical protein